MRFAAAVLALSLAVPLLMPAAALAGERPEAEARDPVRGGVLFLRCSGHVTDNGLGLPGFAKTYQIDEKAGVAYSYDGWRNTFVEAGRCDVGPSVTECRYSNPDAAQYQHFTINRRDGVFHRQVDIRDVHIESDGVCSKMR